VVVDDAKTLIEKAVSTLLAEVPALGALPIVVGIELRGRGDVQQYRVENPGPIVTKDIAADARIRIDVRREFFNEMVGHGAKVADWREAFTYGQARATGSEQYLRLIEKVVDKAEERQRTRRARPH
jgi:hypothetical protein